MKKFICIFLICLTILSIGSTASAKTEKYKRGYYVCRTNTTVHIRSKDKTIIGKAREGTKMYVVAYTKYFAFGRINKKIGIVFKPYLDVMYKVDRDVAESAIIWAGYGYLLE